MFLFVVSGLMLLGVLPYQLVTDNFKWSYAPAILLWLWVGHYSYINLFPKQMFDIAVQQHAPQARIPC